jgi:hypothetical protein
MYCHHFASVFVAVVSCPCHFVNTTGLNGNKLSRNVSNCGLHFKKMGTIVHSYPHLGLGRRSCCNIHSISLFCHEMVEPQIYCQSVLSLNGRAPDIVPVCFVMKWSSPKYSISLLCHEMVLPPLSPRYVDQLPLQTFLLFRVLHCWLDNAIIRLEFILLNQIFMYFV